MKPPLPDNGILSDASPTFVQGLMAVALKGHTPTILNPDKIAVGSICLRLKCGEK